MSNPNEFEFSHRHTMVSLGIDVWFRSEPLIEKLVCDLTAKLADHEQQDAVVTSFEKMRGIARSLMDDIDYIKKENAATFKDYIEDLKNVLKIVYGCVPLLPDAPLDPPDDINFLRWNFFETLQRQRRQGITQVYVPITQLVRFLRNVEEHADKDKPTDHITGKKSYGNLYTLVSTFILTTYAYKEILGAWAETLRISAIRRT